MQTAANRKTHMGASQSSGNGSLGNTAKQIKKAMKGATYLAEGYTSSQRVLRVSKIT